MPRALPERIRALVLLALAPAPVAACSAKIAAAPDDAAAPNDAGATGTGSPEVGDACFVVPPDARCDPYWVVGDGSAVYSAGVTNYGSVLWPCGAPAVPADAAPPCARVCLGDGINNCEEDTLCGQMIGYGSSNPPGYVNGPMFADSGSTPVVFQCLSITTGRRPAGLIEDDGSPTHALGDVLARAAHLEAASVDAFLDLAEQLAARGAPRRLLRRLRRAAADEARHTLQMSTLARARGAEPAAVRVDPVGERTLLDLALDNAREGCVRETWGAACAVAQGERAADPCIRATLRAIARDELRHAALSWDLDAWFCARLGAEGRARVAAERSRAIADLEADLEDSTRLPVAMRDDLGLPPPPAARAIVASLRAALWGDAQLEG